MLAGEPPWAKHEGEEAVIRLTAGTAAFHGKVIMTAVGQRLRQVL